MFVKFLSLILILNLSVSQSAENKNVPFKNKLRRSITHLKAMLVTIEDKIKIEKKKLSQIVNNINRKNNVGPARTDATVNPDVEDITIKNHSNTDAMEITTVTPALTTADSFAFPTMFPSPPVNSHWPPTVMIETSVASTVLAETTKLLKLPDSPFVTDMKKVMIEDNHNYFTAFLTRFTELVAIKNAYDTKPVLNILVIKLNEKLDELPFDEEVGKQLTQALKNYMPVMSAMTPEKLKSQAMFAHFTLKNKEQLMSPADNRITDFYGHYFNKEDGEELFKALEKFYEYNNGKHTAAEVVDMILNAALKPYLKVKKTEVDTTVVTVSEAVEPEVLETQYPKEVTNYPITATQYPVTVTQYPATTTQYPETATQYPVTATHYPTTATQYPITATQYPVTTTQYPATVTQNPLTAIQYTITATQFPITATQYPITVSMYPATATQYPLTATQYEVTTHYQVPSWRRNMNLKQNVKRVLYPKLLEKIREHYKIDNNKSHHPLSPRRKLDENGLKIRDRQLDEQEQIKKIRKVYNYPKYFQDIVKNYMSDKTKEVASYNDEEENLRTNLYDALRHGNMTLVSFRKSGGDVISNHPIRDLSSEPEDEWILKNNIYKVFGPK
ncbi:hypothetical protein PYW08_008376 [Mythimna loreyi]|uniref:Uncharacterized protein n=1 Tax=Mythimna loreyi TaxID=667449 RepID=A0ACC2QBP9_9NEOP|nr:hypothetical protein PYW08_008376 [Mythimna loreyi]